MPQDATPVSQPSTGLWLRYRHWRFRWTHRPRWAEFRLPLLIGMFRFAALEAVILNKATSLVGVASALPFRTATVPFGLIAAHWPIVLNLLAGSLSGPGSV